MKNKLLVCACVVALLSAFMTSCREKTDFDAICDSVTESSVSGIFSGAVPDLDNLTIDVVQYRFKEDGTVERIVMASGDGVYAAPDTTLFSSWKLGDYGTANMSRKLILTPADGGDPLELSFSLGGIFSDEHPFAGDKNDKIKDLDATQEAVIGKKWCGNDTTYFKIDTVVDVTKFDTIYTYKPKKDPETGKTMRDSDGHIIYEQTIKEIKETIVPTKMKWPIAPKTIDIREIELNRDPVSLENTGKWYLVAKVYEMDENTRETTCKLDTTSVYEFHWAFGGFSSASSFIIRARQTDGTQEYFDVKYDGKMPAMTIDKQLLKVSE